MSYKGWVTRQPMDFCDKCRTAFVAGSAHTCRPPVPCWRCKELLPPGMGGLCANCAKLGFKPCPNCGGKKSEPLDGCKNWVFHNVK